MTDFNDFISVCENNLKNTINNSTKEISYWFNSEFKTFEPGNPFYNLYVKSLQSSNDLFISNLNSYHKWLLENFIVSPKNQ